MRRHLAADNSPAPAPRSALCDAHDVRASESKSCAKLCRSSVRGQSAGRGFCARARTHPGWREAVPPARPGTEYDGIQQQERRFGKRNGSATILIAEDHLDSRDAMRALLEAFGYRVLEA